MIQSKLRDLEELQVNGCLTDTCLVGASDKMFIHRAMLLAAHVEPNPIWFDPDPGEEDGKVIVIIPDASTLELEAFVRRLYCPTFSTRQFLRLPSSLHHNQNKLTVLRSRERKSNDLIWLMSASDYLTTKILTGVTHTPKIHCVTGSYNANVFSF